MTTTCPSYYASAAGGEHRQRCSGSPTKITNHNASAASATATTVQIPSSVAAAAAAAASRVTVDADDDMDADQKYDRKAKARLQKRRRRKQQLDNGGGSFWLSQYATSGTGKPPTVAQMAGLLMLFTALLTLWHYMRTVWWTHGRLVARHAREAKMSLYQVAEERLREFHYQTINAPFEKNNFDPERPYRQRHEQQERKRQQRLQQQQQRQQENDESTYSDDVEEHRRGGRARHQPQQQEQEEEMDMAELEEQSTNRLQQLFLEKRRHIGSSTSTTSTSVENIQKILVAWLNKLNEDMLSNAHGGIRWIRPYLLPPLPGQSKPDDDEEQERRAQQIRGGGGGGGRGGGGGPRRHGRHQQQQRQDSMNMQQDRMFFKVNRMTKTAAGSASALQSHFAWEDEWNEMIQQHQNEKDASATAHLVQDGDASATDIARKLAKPVVDYTAKEKYKYPQPLLAEPPEHGGYPKMTTLSSMMEHWDQDEDFEGTITENLMHFNFSNPKELEMARNFRDAELPFKLVGVPELDAANKKWTDEYLAKQFDRNGNTASGFFRKYFHQQSDEEKNDPDLQIPPASGLAQESPNHYFAFFTPPQWSVETMGLPPVRNNDWTFEKWSQHAKYADAVQLSPDQPHFYWQSGVDREERQLDYKKWSFISRDLPSWSSPTETFMVFHPESQKGIQCRFGERGVVAATHYDSGRNMVGMITGAKRYILSPPKACSKLGIFTHQRSPIFRHSLLNFGHLKYLKDDNDKSNGEKDNENSMSLEERAWLERAAQAEAVETVLKAGEVLYIPSMWFHYIISIQKSAQCNVRSGVDRIGTREFGGHQDVVECVD